MKTTNSISIEDLAVDDILEIPKEANIPSQLPLRKWLYAWLLDPTIPGNHQKGIDKEGVPNFV